MKKNKMQRTETEWVKRRFIAIAYTVLALTVVYLVLYLFFAVFGAKTDLIGSFVATVQTTLNIVAFGLGLYSLTVIAIHLSRLSFEKEVEKSEEKKEGRLSQGEKVRKRLHFFTYGLIALAVVYWFLFVFFIFFMRGSDLLELIVAIVNTAMTLLAWGVGLYSLIEIALAVVRLSRVKDGKDLK